MSEPSKTKGLSFGELLSWHLLSGTRPKGSSQQGRAWGKGEFAAKVGIKDRQLRYWLGNEKFPVEIATVERELFGNDQDYAREARLELREAYSRTKSGAAAGDAASSPETPRALSNIPIRLPRHFLGRDDALAAIEAALKRYEGCVAITALHGLRGVGKTTLAAAYAERHRAEYRATWWIRAQTHSTMRADLVALGVRLSWVAADEKEEPALAAVRERLRHEGAGLLLIYDNAPDSESLRPFLPAGGGAQLLVTSNARVWRGIAEPVEIRLWPKEIGADYLIVRTGRAAERAEAEALSLALGGLPLAHEQAAAYCDRLEVSFADYRKRFDAAPARLLDDAKHAPAQYHDGLTVAKTFALAIEKAAKLHPAAEPLIVHAALLAPEPIPLFLFTEGREALGEPLASALAGDGLEEALAALRAFALVDRETVADERDPAITTETMRLHRLVRDVAAGRCEGEEREDERARWIEVMAGVYPPAVYVDPTAWPRARRLNALACGLFCHDALTTSIGDARAIDLLTWLGAYQETALGAYQQARAYYDRALATSEVAFGLAHPRTARCLDNLALLLHAQGDLGSAQPLYERALAIFENTRGPEHPDTSTSVNNLAILLRSKGDLNGARALFERALSVREREFGAAHQETARVLNNLAAILDDQGEKAKAKFFYRRALGIFEETLGQEHPDTACGVNNLASLLMKEGNFTEARPLLARALAMCEKAYGIEHPNTAVVANNLADLLFRLGDFAAAEPLFLRAIATGETALGLDHPLTLRFRANYARLLTQTARVAVALPLAEAALAVHAKNNGPNHPWTKDSARAVAEALEAVGRADEAAAVRRQHAV